MNSGKGSAGVSPALRRPLHRPFRATDAGRMPALQKTTLFQDWKQVVVEGCFSVRAAEKILMVQEKAAQQEQNFCRKQRNQDSFATAGTAQVAQHVAFQIIDEGCCGWIRRRYRLRHC